MGKDARLDRLLPFVPALFVFLWSTGWISARAAAYDADALTFLAVRFTLAALCMAAICVALRAPWPRGQALWHAIATGLLLHAIYLGAVWYAVGQGVPAGVSGVLAGSQPLLTALFAPALLNETITRRQWAGIIAGFVGILLVLQPKLTGLDAKSLTTLRIALVINFIGMIAVTAGTFYQKKFLVTGDLRSIATVQYVAAAAAIWPVAWAVEPMRLNWTWMAIATMVWSVLAISVGAIALLLWLIRRGVVSQIAAYIYLVPPVVIVEAWLLFGETITPIQMLGVAITVAGVALAVRSPTTRS